MAEWSKAPDSRVDPCSLIRSTVRFLVLNWGRGFESHFWQMILLIDFAKMYYGSGGIRTHASEETGALNQRLRPLGHATSLKILKLVFPKSEMNLLSVFFISSFDSPFLLPLSTIQLYYRQLDLLPCWTHSNFGYKLVHGIPKPSSWDKVYSNVGFDEFWINCLVTLSGGKCAVTRSTSSLVEFSNLCTELNMQK